MGIVARGKLLDWWIYKFYKGGFKNQWGGGNLYPTKHGKRGNPGMIVAKIYYPEDPKTDFQQAWRDVLRQANYTWQYFEQGVKSYYNSCTTPKAYDGNRRYLSMYLHANYPPEVGDTYLIYEPGDFILFSEGNKTLSVQVFN
jgi:hypothetical protein